MSEFPSDPSTLVPLPVAPQTRRTTLVGVALVIVSSVAFSAKAVMAKLMYRYGVHPVAVLTLRMGFALPIYLASVARGQQRGPSLARRDLWGILALGIFAYYGSSLGDFLGLRFVSAGLERLILFSYPVLVVLLAAVVLGDRIRRPEIAALALTYSGIALAFRAEAHGGEHVVLGAAIVFAAAVAYAAYLVFGTRYIRRLGTERFTSLALSGAAFAALLHFTVLRPRLLGYPAAVYGLGLGMALFATVLPTYALAAGIRRIGPGPSAVLGTVGPVSTIFLAHALLSEPLSAMQLLGTLVVLAGAVLMARDKA